MSEQGTEPDRHSFAGLVGRMAEDGQRLVRAEVALYRAIALHRLALSRGAIAMLAAALLILLSALIMLLVMIAIALSERFGALGAGLVVAGVALVVAGLLGFAGYARLRDVIALGTPGKDAHE